MKLLKFHGLLLAFFALQSVASANDVGVHKDHRDVPGVLCAGRPEAKAPARAPASAAQEGRDRNADRAN